MQAVRDQVAMVLVRALLFYDGQQASVLIRLRHDSLALHFPDAVCVGFSVSHEGKCTGFSSRIWMELWMERFLPLISLCLQVPGRLLALHERWEALVQVQAVMH